MIKTQGVLHFSLPATDLDRSAKFYHELLGMKIVEQTPRMVFLQSGENYFIMAKGNAPVKYDSAPEHSGASCFQSKAGRLRAVD